MDGLIYKDGVCLNAIVDRLEWHQLTEFRHLDELYKYKRSLYEDWKSKGYLPYKKIAEIEG